MQRPRIRERSTEPSSSEAEITRGYRRLRSISDDTSVRRYEGENKNSGTACVWGESQGRLSVRTASGGDLPTIRQHSPAQIGTRAHLRSNLCDLNTQSRPDVKRYSTGDNSHHPGPVPAQPGYTNGYRVQCIISYPTTTLKRTDAYALYVLVRPLEGDTFARHPSLHPPHQKNACTHTRKPLTSNYSIGSRLTA